MVLHRKLEESDVKCGVAAPEAVAVFSHFLWSQEGLSKKAEIM